MMGVGCQDNNGGVGACPRPFASVDTPSDHPREELPLALPHTLVDKRMKPGLSHLVSVNPHIPLSRGMFNSALI